MIPYNLRTVIAYPLPGNILVVPNPTKPADPFLCLLDHGLYEHLQDETRLSLCSLWKAIVYNDDKGERTAARNRLYLTESD